MREDQDQQQDRDEAMTKAVLSAHSPNVTAGAIAARNALVAARHRVHRLLLTTLPVEPL